MYIVDFCRTIFLAFLYKWSYNKFYKNIKFISIILSINFYFNLYKRRSKKIKSIQKWIPIENILDKGIIKIGKNKYIKILKIIPINFNLKTQLEKEAILNSYKIFLKTCNFDMQILIQSKREDLSSHIENIQKISEKEKNKIIRKYSEKYLEFINEKNNKNKSASKNIR